MIHGRFIYNCYRRKAGLCKYGFGNTYVEFKCTCGNALRAQR